MVKADDIRELVDLMQAKGVRYLRAGDLEIAMGQQPVTDEPSTDEKNRPPPPDMRTVLDDPDLGVPRLRRRSSDSG